MNTLIKTITVTMLLSTSYIANATLIYGTKASTSIADCPSFCTNFNFGSFLGGEGTTSTGVSLVSSARGSASASAQLTGGLNTPVLKAKSEANPSLKGAFATAFGVQGYTYNGAGGSITLDINLDGMVTDLDSDPSDTRVFMEVVLYETENFAFFLDRGTLDFEFGATPLVQNNIFANEASVQLQLDHTNPASANGQISIDVTTGDEFYLWAILQARSESGSKVASANAFNTGTMTFLGNPDLISASPVPVPTAIWLFGLGLIGLISITRRRQV